MALKGGYMGLCQVNGIDLRVTSFNVNVKQEAEFYEHIIGLRDSIPSGLGTKGDVGALNVQKYFWRPGVKICQGNFSFPVTVSSLQEFYDLAKTGDYFNLDYYYDCDNVKRSYVDCRVNSLSFSCTAGDTVNLNVDIMGRKLESEGGGIISYQSSQKLVTWDALEITSSSSNGVQAFNFNVNNNCKPIYTAGANDTENLFPKGIRVGMQNVTGSIVYYTKGVSYDGLDPSTSSDTINIKITTGCGGSFSESLTVVYTPIERQGNTKLPLHTLPFVGVGNALGT